MYMGLRGIRALRYGSEGSRSVSSSSSWERLNRKDVWVHLSAPCRQETKIMLRS